MVKVFYHNDPDGWCSAALVRFWLEKEKIPFKSEDFIEMNYDMEFPLDIVERSEPVFIVDFSLKSDVFWDLRCKTRDITWIDHHKTAIESIDLDALDLSHCAGLRIDGVAACMLTWIYFNSNAKFNPTYIASEIIESAPKFVQYIHLWDTWQWKNQSDHEYIEAFITALMTRESHPLLSEMWDKLYLKKEFPNYMMQLVQEGYACIRFRDGYGKTCCDSIGKVIKFEGYRCFVCNMPKCNSEWFKSVNQSDYDILMPFYFNMQTQCFVFSLYTSNQDIDVSKIAVKYGGGGHKGASGFQTDNLHHLPLII